MLNILLLTTLVALPPPVSLPANAAIRTDQLVTQDSLRALMQALDTGSGLMLTIGHAGGEAGSARADELRAALVALGLDSARITLAPQPLDEPVLILTLDQVKQ